MWLIIKSFVSANTAKVMEWAAIIGGAILAVMTIFNAGKKAEKASALQYELDLVGKAHDVENKNKAELHDGDAAHKLQSDWSR